MIRNNLPNRHHWSHALRQLMAWPVLVAALLVLSQAHAQTSVSVNAPNNGVGGSPIVFTVGLSTLTPVSNVSFQVKLDNSLQNVGLPACLSGPCGQVTGLAIDSNNLITGTIISLGANQSVSLQITGKVPTEKSHTSYANPPSISTVGTMTAGGVSTTSTGNTTIQYLPYTIEMTPTIVSPTSTFAFDTDEIVFQNVYKNTGPGPADGAFINSAVYMRDSVNLDYAPWTLNGLQFSCTATGGAQCPSMPPAAGGNRWYGQTAVYEDRVPAFPVGGVVTITYRFKIAKPATTMQCGATVQAVVANTIGLGESPWMTEETRSDQMSPPQVISTVPIQLPPCPQADLAVQNVQLPTALILGSHTAEFKYTNAGPATVNAQLDPGYTGGIWAQLDSEIAFARDPGVCVSATGGAVCPDANGVVINMPPGGEVVMRRPFTLTQTQPLQCGANDPQTGMSYIGRVFVNSSIDFAAPAVDPVTGLNYTDPVRSNNDTSNRWLDLYLPRPACPVQDLGAQVTAMPAAITFGDPYVVQFAVSNYGADNFVWAPPSNFGNGPANIDLQNMSGVAAVQFSSATLACTPSGGAVCPALTQPASFQSPFAISWVWRRAGDAYGLNNAFSIPAGGALNYTMTMMPTGYAAGCLNGTSANPFRASVEFLNLPPYLEPYPSDPHPNYDIKESTQAPECQDLTVNKQLLVNGVQTNSVDVNGDMSFNLTASAPAASQGGKAVTNAIIEDVLPAGFVFDPTTPNQLACTVVPSGDTVTQCATLASGVVWDAATRLLRITTPVLQAGSSVSYSVLGKAVNQSGAWTNAATLVMNDQNFYDANLNSNQSNVEFSIKGPDPIIVKSTNDPVIAYAGAPVRYSIVISNPDNGGTLTSATLSDVLPAGFTLQSTSAPILVNGATGQASFSAAQTPQTGATTLNWGEFMLPPGASATVDFVVKSNPALKCSDTDIIHNSASLGYQTQAGPKTVTYDGAAPGHPREDVKFPCTPTPLGALAVSLAVTGEPLPAGFVPDAGVFALCTDPATSAQTRHPTSGYATIAANALAAQFDNIASQSQCEVQIDPAKPITAAPAGYHWQSATPAISPQPAAIADGQITAVAAQWVLMRDVANLVVNFSALGGPAGYAGALPVSAVCDVPAAGTPYPATGTVAATPQTPATIVDIPVGANCSVATGALPGAPTGYRWLSTAAPAVPANVLISTTGASSAASATMALDDVINPGGNTGSLNVAFVPTGLPTGYAPTLQVFATCNLPATGTRYPTTGTVAVTAQGNVALAGIPVSAQCNVTLDSGQLPVAPAGYQWQGSPSTAQPGTISATGVTATITWVMVSTATQPGGETTVQVVPVNRWQALLLASLALVLLAAARQRRHRG